MRLEWTKLCAGDHVVVNDEEYEFWGAYRRVDGWHLTREDQYVGTFHHLRTAKRIAQKVEDMEALR